MTGSQERKRKRGKKLRWSAWARGRAALGGRIVRRVLRAKRRLDKMDWEQDYQWWHSNNDVEEEKQVSVSMLPKGLEESMLGLKIDRKNETILIVEEVSRSLAGLQLMGEGIQPWETEEYQWIDNVDTTKDKEQESLNTPWFDWGEEKREHWDLERLLHSLELNVSQEEPEPSQAGNPGSAADRLGALKGCPDGWGGACTSPFPTGVKPQPFCSQAGVLCGKCGSWLWLGKTKLRIE